MTRVKKAAEAAPAPQPGDNTELSPELALSILGDTGLKRYGGFVSEEILKELADGKGVKLFREMADNHPVIGGILFAITYLLRSVPWTVESASESPEDIKAADLVSSCLDDMAQTWQSTITEILSFMTFGWSLHEICYKRRKGSNLDPMLNSRYNDNLLGWAGFPIRSQDSLYKWEFDDNGNVLGMHQQVLNTNSGDTRGTMRFIPMVKAMLFTTDSSKGNPHGRSVLRSSVVTFLKQRKIEEIECIGIERDLAGFPVVTVPVRIMNKSASPDDKALFEQFKNIVKSIRRDKTEGIVLPSDNFKDTNTPMFDLKLLSTGGTRQFNTSEIIQREDTRIAMTMLADFMILGHSKSGSYALSDNKIELFQVALGGFLDIIAEKLNRAAVPQLLALNGFDLEETPRLKPGKIDKGDLEKLANYIGTLSGAGMMLFPDPALEQHLRQVAELPEPSVDVGREVGTGGGDDIKDTPNRLGDQQPQEQPKPGQQDQPPAGDR